MYSTVELIEAQRLIGEGNPDFMVLTAQASEHHGSMMKFIVAVPMATMRYGIFGRMSKSYGGDGRDTKFGNDIFSWLNAIKGVEASLSGNIPHIITLYIDSRDMQDPPTGMRNQSQGLPANVCWVIQAAILHNRSFGQRLMEYLRRLF